MSVLVYQAIDAVAAELSETGIAKRHRNEPEDYSYRSIEDVLSALAPLLARHKLCVLPRVLEREGQIAGDKTAQLVMVRAAFDMVSALDGSRHTIESFGEAIDESDKGTAKAISAAFKSAMLQAFCIPVPEEDADATSPRKNGHFPQRIVFSEPPEGWQSWAGEVMSIARSCDTSEAVERLMTSRRSGLAALQRSRPDIYAGIGEAVAQRLDSFRGESAKPAPAKVRSRAGKQRRAKANAAEAA